MTLHSMRDWLGMKRTTAVAGVHLSSSHLSMAVVRPNPTRLTALGRQAIQEAAVVNDEVRLSATLAQHLSGMVEALNLPSGIGVVAAIEPRESVLQVLDGEAGATCPVSQAAHDRLVDAIHGAGLKLLRVDPVPVALARLARLVEPELAALRGAFRWSIMTGDGYTEAECSDHDGDPHLRIGSDFASVRQADRLPIKTVRQLRSIPELNRDAVALGAALAGFDLPPLIDVKPVPEGRGSDWTVQPVASPRANQPQHRWSPPASLPFPEKASK